MLADISIYLGVMLAGLVSFLSPCVLPLVPPYLGYLGGTTLDQLANSGRDERAVARRVVLASLCFVAGFTTVFVALGAGASVIGQLIQVYKAPLSIAAGLVIILFGLHFLGLLHVPVLFRQVRFSADMDRASYAGAYLIGLAFAFGWTPCIGPILATVLAVAANEDSVGAGVRLLFAYSLGLGIPFVLAAVAVRPFLGFFKRFRPYLARMEQVMGGLLVVTGVLFLTGSINIAGQWLIEHVPALSAIEESLTPKSLQKEILKRNGG